MGAGRGGGNVIDAKVEIALGGWDAGLSAIVVATCEITATIALAAHIEMSGQGSFSDSARAPSPALMLATMAFCCDCTSLASAQ